VPGVISSGGGSQSQAAAGEVAPPRGPGTPPPPRPGAAPAAPTRRSGSAARATATAAALKANSTPAVAFTLAQARAAAAACGAACAAPPRAGPVLPRAPWARADLDAFDADGDPVNSELQAGVEGGATVDPPEFAAGGDPANRGGRTLAGVSLTLVYYGPGWSRGARGTLDAFAAGLGASPWLSSALSPFALASRAVDVLTPVTVADASDGCWRGATLTPGAVAAVAACAVDAGRAPLNATTQLVVVLGDAGTDQVPEGAGAAPVPAAVEAAADAAAADAAAAAAPGAPPATPPPPPPPHLGSLCVDHCGWHASARAGGGERVAAAFAGHPARCPAACAPQWPSAPSGDAAASAVANAIAAIVVGAATDPDLTGWRDGSGAEAASRCAWRFGPAPAPAPDGGVANAAVGGKPALLQQVWSPATGACA